MNDLAKNLMLWVVVAVVLMVVFQSFSPKLATSQEVVYSQFIADVQDDRIKKVDISSDERTIKFERKDNSTGTTTAPRRDEGLVNDLINHKVEIKQAPPDTGISFWALVINFLPVILIIGFWLFMMRQMQQGGGKGAMSFGRSRAKLLNEDQTKITFADVAGCDEAKEEVSELVEFLRDPGRFQKLGGKIPRGVLMVGPPGTGKTLAGQGHRRRGQGAVLLDLRFRLRRDVRRRRRQPRTRHVRAGQEASAVHHLHRRDRCGRSPSWRRSGRRP